MPHRDNRGHHAEYHVEAYKELVDKASIWLGVKDEEEQDSNKWQDVVEDCNPEQSWKQKVEKSLKHSYKTSTYSISDFEC